MAELKDQGIQRASREEKVAEMSSRPAGGSESLAHLNGSASYRFYVVPVGVRRRRECLKA